MGYYTYYNIDIKFKNETDGMIAIINKLKDYIHNNYSKFPFSSEDISVYEDVLSISGVEAKWYDFETAMTELSEAVPELVFWVNGNGEDMDDIWDAYFYNGEEEYVPWIIKEGEVKTIGKLYKDI